jgi:hypothetical protein
LAATTYWDRIRNKKRPTNSIQITYSEQLARGEVPFEERLKR